MKLQGLGTPLGVATPLVGKITTTAVPQESCRGDFILLWRQACPPADPSAYLAILVPDSAPTWQGGAPIVHSFSGLDYLRDGDIVRVEPGGVVHALYRRHSRHNFILMTEQCNSRCLMCSQPPKRVSDFDRISEHFRLVDLIDPDTQELGITGGEPTLFRDDFLRLIEHCKVKLPRTALHVLTNGRMFYYRTLAQRLAEIAHPDLMVGIPLYSDVDSEHDYVVQARGAFEETVLGIHHLARHNLRVEIRVVIHRQTYLRLGRLAEFVVRNFPFAAHVALMGMEMSGLVYQNLDQLWIDPCDYQAELREAAETLFESGINVSIYNHQLCVLDRTLWRFARKSISDWKNIYLEVCEPCTMRQHCGGFFQSAAKKHSGRIKPFRAA
jgi:His-Xaa-Ser system radical SAM maturase HxsC